MMFNSLIFITSTTLISSTILALMSSSWVCVWLMMELNLMSFIPIMLSSNQNTETEASVKYFLVQAVGSALLLMSSYVMYFSFNITNLFNTILLLALLLKLGSFPTFFWFPSVMACISWSSSLILSTWQKIAPITLISMTLTSFNIEILALVAGMNSLVGGIMGMNQTNLRKLLAYSSINHMGWMISMLYMNMPMFCIMYFCIYVLLVTPIFYIMITSSTLNQSANMMNKCKTHQLTLIILLLSLAGLPPLTGFLPKLCIMIMLMSHNSILLIILIIGSLLTLYFYLMLAISIINMNSMSFYQNHFRPTYTISFMNITSLMYLPMIMLI